MYVGICNNLLTVNQLITCMRSFTLREHVISSGRDPKGILKLKNSSNNVPLHQMTEESQAEVFTNSIRT
jgi:hypothetical protein